MPQNMSNTRLTNRSAMLVCFVEEIIIKCGHVVISHSVLHKTNTQLFYLLPKNFELCSTPL